jgi:hypothetical protein
VGAPQRYEKATATLLKHDRYRYRNATETLSLPKRYRYNFIKFKNKFLRKIKKFSGSVTLALA